MMNIERRMAAFTQLGASISMLLEDHKPHPDQYGEQIGAFKEKLKLAEQQNAWFIPEFINKALEGIAMLLEPDSINAWIEKYPPGFGDGSLRVAVVMAGNVPAVGFHDFLTVLMAGHSIQAKLSSDDNVIIPALAELLTGIEPGFRERIAFTDEKIHDFDAVIATGSNNTARYFNYYFGKYPHIIRKNRNAVAVIKSDEKPESLRRLADDIFLYFGLGCRNVSKIYVPEDMDISSFLDYFEHYSWIADQSKYRNNYDYNKSLYLVNGDHHYDNGFLLVKESEAFASPVSVLHYERYDDPQQLVLNLQRSMDQIQCIISEDKTHFPEGILPGQAQYPELWDYADGVDTMEFLLTLLKDH
jgi:hypothetical protein